MVWVSFLFFFSMFGVSLILFASVLIPPGDTLVSMTKWFIQIIKCILCIGQRMILITTHWRWPLWVFVVLLDLGVRLIIAISYFCMFSTLFEYVVYKQVWKGTNTCNVSLHSSRLSQHFMPFGSLIVHCSMVLVLLVGFNVGSRPINTFC